MKSNTDLPQSKMLAEILPLESADMYWWYNGRQYYAETMEHGDFQKGDIPAWSLAALLGYLNQDWYVNLSHDGICWQCVIDHHDRKERRCSSVLTDEPVDCCVELIVKLKEENLI